VVLYIIKSTFKVVAKISSPMEITKVGNRSQVLKMSRQRLAPFYSIPFQMLSFILK